MFVLQGATCPAGSKELGKKTGEMLIEALSSLDQDQNWEDINLLFLGKREL